MAKTSMKVKQQMAPKFSTRAYNRCKICGRPHAYLRSEKDILKLVNTIIANTKGDGEKSGEDFWVSATRSQAVKSLRTVLVY